MIIIYINLLISELKHVQIQIQTDHSNREYWQMSISSLKEEFNEITLLYGTTLILELYKS